MSYHMCVSISLHSNYLYCPFIHLNGHLRLDGLLSRHRVTSRLLLCLHICTKPCKHIRLELQLQYLSVPLIHSSHPHHTTHTHPQLQLQHPPTPQVRLPLPLPVLLLSPIGVSMSMGICMPLGRSSTCLLLLLATTPRAVLRQSHERA